MYAEGRGVTQDRAHALALWSLLFENTSSDHDREEAKRLFGIVATESIEEEIEEAANIARELSY